MVSGIFKIEDIDPNGYSGLPTCPNSFSFFDTIPPERMGLNGEYDYHGLAKRVCQLFQQQIGSEELRSLKVKQRGAVVILIGKVQTYALLARLVHLALSVTGTVDVEAQGVSVQEGRDRVNASARFFSSPTYSYS